MWSSRKNYIYYRFQNQSWRWSIEKNAPMVLKAKQCAVNAVNEYKRSGVKINFGSLVSKINSKTCGKKYKMDVVLKIN